MKVKNLVKKFSFRGLEAECLKQGWVIPSVAEIKDVKTEYQFFWVSDKPKYEDASTHAFLYNSKSGRKILVNKNNMYECVVIKKMPVTHRDVYEKLFRNIHSHYTLKGFTVDKANRKANIYAVQYTKDRFNEYVKDGEWIKS